MSVGYLPFMMLEQWSKMLMISRRELLPTQIPVSEDGVPFPKYKEEGAIRNFENWSLRDSFSNVYYHSGRKRVPVRRTSDDDEQYPHRMDSELYDDQVRVSYEISKNHVDIDYVPQHNLRVRLPTYLLLNQLEWVCPIRTRRRLHSAGD